MTRDGPVSEPARRRRALSEEERALWEGVARGVRPLRTKPRPLTADADVAEPRAGKPHPAPPSQPFRPAIARPEPTKPAVPPLVPIPRRERSRLSRGKGRIAARIDLHGMTQARAHRALLGFLSAAQADGLGIVLVITGKGAGKGAAEGERGVLRRQVPHWLGLPEFRALVTGCAPAHLYHGGEGALYVRIRRARRITSFKG